MTGGGQTTTYTWDVWGQLRRVDLPGGGVIEYAIDGAGRRVGRKKNGAWTARWVYGAGLGPVAELDGDGYVAKRFVYGSHANVPDYVVTLTRTSTTTLESVAAVVHDRRGGVRELIAMTDSLSSVHTTYDEYGRVSDPNPVNVGVTVPFGFAGGMYDPETGLVHLGAREYDPQTGRWLTPDPIGFAGGPNLYGYVLADPVNYIDPLGHGPEITDRFLNNWFYNGFNWWMDCLGGAGTANEFWSPNTNGFAIGISNQLSVIMATVGLNFEIIGNIQSIGFIPTNFTLSDATGLYVTGGLSLPVKAISGNLSFNAAFNMSENIPWQGPFLEASVGASVTGGVFGGVDSSLRFQPDAWYGLSVGRGIGIGFPGDITYNIYKPIWTLKDLRS